MQAERIKELMFEMGWSGADMIRAINSRGKKISSGGVTHWLNGKTKNIKAEYIMAIAEASGYNVKWLIEGIGEKRNELWVKESVHPLDEYKRLFDEANSTSQEMVISILKNLKNFKK